ncbi:MAG TPA: hypothetical protein ENJ37_08370 [Deltaproteobacteria bacterium]|nr:hypothetical protein [Deltaproteobacteria bacterium]
MVLGKSNAKKIAWCGRIKAVQPRIRPMRSFDERHHSYQGYVLRVDGTIGDSSDLSDPHIIAAEVTEDIESALKQIRDALGDLEERANIVKEPAL